MSDRLVRIRRIVGDHGIAKLADSFVIVVGVGAVGGYAVEALARAGIGKMRLIDHDIVEPSNINRQLLALGSTIGQPKVELARTRVMDINPNCEVETLKEFVHDNTMDEALSGNPDLVIDAIDSLLPKTLLLRAVQERSIPVVSSMGAALRRDPGMIKTGPLTGSVQCPLARHVRKRLRKWGCSTEFTCVYSAERTDLLPETAIGDSDPAETEQQRGRIRKEMGSMPTITGIFGLTAAQIAINKLLED